MSQETGIVVASNSLVSWYISLCSKTIDNGLLRSQCAFASVCPQDSLVPHCKVRPVKSTVGPDWDQGGTRQEHARSICRGWCSETRCRHFGGRKRLDHVQVTPKRIRAPRSSSPDPVFTGALFEGGCQPKSDQQHQQPSWLASACTLSLGASRIAWYGVRVFSGGFFLDLRLFPERLG